MKSLTRRPGGTGAPVRGIDRMVRNVRTGQFERSLSALTAAGALVTAAEIYFEHDSASFGNTMMCIPVALGAVGAAAGVAGFMRSGPRRNSTFQGVAVKVLPASGERLIVRPGYQRLSTRAGPDRSPAWHSTAMPRGRAASAPGRVPCPGGGGRMKRE